LLNGIIGILLKTLVEFSGCCLPTLSAHQARTNKRVVCPLAWRWVVLRLRYILTHILIIAVTHTLPHQHQNTDQPPYPPPHAPTQTKKPKAEQRFGSRRSSPAAAHIQPSPAAVLPSCPTTMTPRLPRGLPLPAGTAITTTTALATASTTFIRMTTPPHTISSIGSQATSRPPRPRLLPSSPTPQLYLQHPHPDQYSPTMMLFVSTSRI